MIKQLLLILIAATLAFSQSSIEIADASASGSPVTLKGNVSFANTQAAVTVTGHNNSNKGVLAYLVVIETSPLLNFRVEHDHYFKGEDIAATSDFSVCQGPAGEFPLDTDMAKQVADQTVKGQAKVLWVQLEDGSTWGDAAEGATISAQRVANRAFFVHLLTVQKESGDAAFVQELSAPQPAGSSVEGLAKVFKHLQQTDGTTALIDHINKRLAIGNARAF